MCRSPEVKSDVVGVAAVERERERQREGKQTSGPGKPGLRLWATGDVFPKTNTRTHPASPGHMASWYSTPIHTAPQHTAPQFIARAQLSWFGLPQKRAVK